MNFEALHNHFEQQAALPQRFGVVDCVTFVVESLLIGWDKDYRHALGYFSRRSAVTRLRRAGGLYTAVCEHLGAPIPIHELREGDIVWMPEPATLGLKMVGLQEYVAVKGHFEIRRYEISPWMTGWRVP